MPVKKTTTRARVRSTKPAVTITSKLTEADVGRFKVRVREMGGKILVCLKPYPAVPVSRTAEAMRDRHPEYMMLTPETLDELAKAIPAIQGLLPSV